MRWELEAFRCDQNDVRGCANIFHYRELAMRVPPTVPNDTPNDTPALHNGGKVVFRGPAPLQKPVDRPRGIDKSSGSGIDPPDGTL